MTHSSSQYSTGGSITNTVVGSSGAFGVRSWPLYLLDIVPLTKNATAYAASQSPAAAALTLSAGTGITTMVDYTNTTRYVADVARTIVIVSGGNDSGITFLARGYDLYGAAMSEAITGANAGTATGKKAFKSVISITPSAAAAGTVTAGTSDVLGMPVQVSDKGYVSVLGWNNTIGYDTGTFTVSDTTTPATSTTGDTRGTYLPSSATNGSKRLVTSICLNSVQLTSAPSAAGVIAILGVTQA